MRADAVREVGGTAWVTSTAARREQWWGEALVELDRVLRREGVAPGGFLRRRVHHDEAVRTVRLRVSCTAGSPAAGVEPGLPWQCLTTAGLGDCPSGGDLLAVPHNPL